MEGKESETGDLEKVGAIVKQLISPSFNFRRVERNGRVNRLLESDHRKASILFMLKTVWKGLGDSLSVNAMDKVEPFQVTIHCNSGNLSMMHAGSLYSCSQTVLSMVSNTRPEEQCITNPLDIKTFIAVTL